MAVQPTIIPDGKEHSGSVHIPSRYAEDVSRVLITYSNIFNKVSEIAEQVSVDYRGRDLYLLCVMKGAKMFCDDLYGCMHGYNGVRSITRGEVSASSYINTESTGEVSVQGDLSGVKGLDVLIVEDIIDTGLTMSELVKHVKMHDPASVKVAALLKKRLGKETFEPDYCCFSIPNEFVIGFGLDYNENLRDMLHVCVISNKAICKYGHKD